MCPPMRAHWRHLENKIEHVLPWAHASPQPKREISGSAIFAQLTANSPYTLHWAPLSLKIAPSHGGSGPHLIIIPLARSESSTQMASRLLHLFLQGSLV